MLLLALALHSQSGAQHAVTGCGKEGSCKAEKKRRHVSFVEHSGPRGAEVNVEFYTWRDSGEQLCLSDNLATVAADLTSMSDMVMRIEKQTQMSSLQGGMPPSCPHVLPPSCPVVSPRRRRLPKPDAHLGTAATPSSAWNRGGCSRTPRGCVPVPGAVGWQAARMLPFPSHAACSPLETATYETGGMEVIYHGEGTWPYPWGAVIMMDWAKRPMLWPVKFILIVLMWYAQSRIVKFHSEIMEWNFICNVY